MTLKYLLDTNILSEAKRPQPNQNVMKKLSLYKYEIAVCNHLILVTNNISDFSDFDQLQVENWLSESTREL